MKKKFILLLLISFQICFSQQIEGYIYDKTDKTPVPYSNILITNSKGGTYSNTEGYFNLNLKNNDSDSLLVSSVGYKTRIIPINQFDLNSIISIELEKEIFELDEAVLTLKKIKYTQKETIGLEKTGRHNHFGLIGSNTVAYIENKKNTRGKLKTIHLYLNKTKKNTSWKSTVFESKLNIRIYKYDKKNNLPGEELLHQNLIVKPKNKKYILKIDIEDYNIKIPKDGICIGVEYIDENNEFKKYEHVAPALRYTESINKNNTWSNYRNRGWKNGTTTFFYKKKYFINLMMKVDVLYPKNKI